MSDREVTQRYNVVDGGSLPRLEGVLLTSVADVRIPPTGWTRHVENFFRFHGTVVPKSTAGEKLLQERNKVPRPERPLDPGDDPLLEFAADLRRLREKAGNPTYRELGRRAHSISSKSRSRAAV